jgi:hypothetical protein
MAQAEDDKPEIGNPEIDAETKPESVVSHSLEPRILDGAFRNGTMTAIGVLLGFSLGFLNSWGRNPLPWDFYDLWAAAPLIAGILLQIVALYFMLQPESLQLANYRRAIKFFVAGLLLACTGVFIALIDDAYVAMSHRGVATEVVN